MSSSTSLLPGVVEGTGAVQVINETFDAASPAIVGARNASTSNLLTWGYIGGRINGADKANGTLALTASNTNYIVMAKTGLAVSVAITTTNWNDSANYWRLYSVVTSATAATSWIDERLSSTGLQGIGGAGGAGLVNFTESVNIAAPNATVPVVSLTATNAATNVDVVLAPKGTGGIAMKTADSTSTGGNKRGTGAIDLQYDLNSSAANVASGATSALVGGTGSKASGANSGVFAGRANTASNAQSVCVGGDSNTASGSTAAILGGTGNTASTGSYTAVVGGSTNTASATQATVLGGQNNLADALNSTASGHYSATRGMIGSKSHASGSLSGTAGLRQKREATLMVNTANATATAITTNGSAAAATNQFNLVTGSGLMVQGQVIVRNNSTGDVGYFTFTGACKNVAGTVSLSGTPVVSAYAGDASLNTCAVAIVADNTNKCLQVTVTGIAATALIWAAEVTSCEIVT
jgi:hypothetical protein